MYIKVTNAEHAQIVAALRVYSESQREFVETCFGDYWKNTQSSVDLSTLANRLAALDPADDGPECDLLSALRA